MKLIKSDKTYTATDIKTYSIEDIISNNTIERQSNRQYIDVLKQAILRDNQ